jgi:hypothetical protein
MKDGLNDGMMLRMSECTLVPNAMPWYVRKEDCEINPLHVWSIECAKI